MIQSTPNGDKLFASEMEKGVKCRDVDLVKEYRFTTFKNGLDAPL